MLFICVAIMLFVATIAFVLLVKNNIKNEFVSSENNCNKEALIEPNVSKHEPDNELIHDDDGDDSLSRETKLNEIKLKINELKSGLCLNSDGFQLDLSKLSNHHLGYECTNLVCNALMSGNCPNNLRIELYGSDIGDEEVEQLSDALKSGKCPKGLRLNLMINDPALICRTPS